MLHAMAFVGRGDTEVTGLRMGQSRSARGQPNRQGEHKNFPQRLPHTLRPEPQLNQVDEKDATADILPAWRMSALGQTRT